jgi:hypothetical protein
MEPVVVTQIKNLTASYIRQLEAILAERSDARAAWKDYIINSGEARPHLMAAVSPWNASIAWPNLDGEEASVTVVIDRESPLNGSRIGVRLEFVWNIATFRFVTVRFGADEEERVPVETFTAMPLLEHIYKYLGPTYEASIEATDSPEADSDDHLAYLD